MGLFFLRSVSDWSHSRRGGVQCWWGGVQCWWGGVQWVLKARLVEGCLVVGCSRRGCLVEGGY